MAYLAAFFQQHLVVFAQCDAEDDRCDVLEAVDPLLSLTSLTTDIKHAVKIIQHFQTL